MVAAEDKSTEVPPTWRIWLDVINVIMLIGGFFVLLGVVWYLAHPVAHMAADIVQRWENGWQEGLNDGPD